MQRTFFICFVFILSQNIQSQILQIHVDSIDMSYYQNNTKIFQEHKSVNTDYTIDLSRKKLCVDFSSGRSIQNLDFEYEIKNGKYILKYVDKPLEKKFQPSYADPNVPLDINQYVTFTIDPKNNTVNWENEYNPEVNDFTSSTKIKFKIFNIKVVNPS